MDLLEDARARRNALRREQYAIDGGKRKTQSQAWKNAHREQVRAASREYQQLRREQNPEVAREEVRRWQEHNPEKKKASYAAWYARNGRAYFRRWMAEDRKRNPVRYMLRNTRTRAKEIGVEFALLPEHIVIPEFCPVLGIKLEAGHGKGGSWKHHNSPSIDRFDNTKGYTPDNIRVISWRANLLKRDATLDELECVVAYMKGRL